MWLPKSTVRKIASILLITVLLFNVFGYYGLFIGLRLKTTHDLIERLDTEAYASEETFTLKLPMAVPYHVDQNDYERVDGEIEYKGEYYRLVKQKLAKDTLYVVCLADRQSKNIKNTLNDYVKTFSDKHDDAKNHGNFFQHLIKDYIATTVAIEVANDGWCNELATLFLPDMHGIQIKNSIVQPPEA